ncbi:sugar phosphate isomerase/epimerase [Clostridium botulinum C]|uniref:sugar phosphate isomerase/epimerase family protein n=1 Tax=Clostridium TaxID=1485 RepID=UPI000EA3EA50|nr:sugar phosphate isomerase/epimerase [Clostridium novyi]AYF54272.1 sugar phosphate isomerase/epimerase [Clostridium novyi]MCD3217766.1 sugar phosphate isomerase/epimerase [Clostridium botulinum C]
MEIGISTACFYPKVLLEDSIKLMKKLNFDKGEIFFNCPSEFDEEFTKMLSERCKEYEFYVNSVHAFSSSFEPYLFDTYKRRRNDMFKYFKKVCIEGKRLGAKTYTFHGMRKIDSNLIDIKNVIDVYNELIYISEEIGITLAQENVSWCMSSDLNFLKNLKEKCKYPIHFTLDLKQAYRTKKEPDEYINIMKENIVNLHINDKNKESSCLLPGNGEINYSKLFSRLRELNYKGMGIIEVYKDNYSTYEELQESRQFLKKIQ